MYKPSDVDVKLFPFVDFEVSEVDEGVYGKKWVFRLKTIKGSDFDLVVQAYSKQDYQAWIKALKEFKDSLSKATSNVK